MKFVAGGIAQKPAIIDPIADKSCADRGGSRRIAFIESNHALHGAAHTFSVGIKDCRNSARHIVNEVVAGLHVVSAAIFGIEQDTGLHVGSRMCAITTDVEALDHHVIRASGSHQLRVVSIGGRP